MKATISVTNPDEIEATISITLTLKQWVELRKEIKDVAFYGPGHQLRSAIDELSQKVNKVFSFYEGDPE